jgi:hypothetical protein
MSNVVAQQTRPINTALMNLILLAAMLCSLSMNSPGQAAFGSSTKEDIEYDLENYYSCILTIDSELLLGYLNATEKFATPLSLTVLVRQLEKDGSWSAPSIYEKVWYKRGQPVGLKRFASLPTQKDMVAFIKDTPLIYDNADSIANLVLRLSLDAAIKQSRVLAVYTPYDHFNHLADAFARMDFDKLSTVGIGDKLVFVHIYSYPKGAEVYLYHKKSGSLKTVQ